MDKARADRARPPGAGPDRSDGRGARKGVLGWAAFLVIAVVATAAIIAGVIRSVSPSGPTATRPSLSGPPTPSPTPLPRPGSAPPRTLLAML